MEVDKIVEVLKQKPYMMDMGAGKLAKDYFKVNKELIYKAKEIVYKEKNKINIPKILVLDIETSPLKVYVWSRWKQNIYLDQTISEWFCLSWAAKWLYSSEVMSDKLTPEEVKNENDNRIIVGLWLLINEADIIIAHNGDIFDVPKINSRFILNNLPPTKPYQTIDTKKIAAKQFGFSSNKLDALAGYFGIEHKMDTDFELWSKCMNGDKESLDYMEIYNRKDVEILEEVYLRLRPWIKNHPNVGLYLDSTKPLCSSCGSENIKKTGEYYYTQVGKYELYRCSCGAISRGRKTVQNKSIRENTIIGIAK